MPAIGNNADTPHSLWHGYYPFKENLGIPTGKENLTSVGFESTTSGLDLSMFYRLSYDASTAASRSSDSLPKLPRPAPVLAS